MACARSGRSSPGSPAAIRPVRPQFRGFPWVPGRGSAVSPGSPAAVRPVRPRVRGFPRGPRPRFVRKRFARSGRGSPGRSSPGSPGSPGSSGRIPFSVPGQAVDGPGNGRARRATNGSARAVLRIGPPGPRQHPSLGPWPWLPSGDPRVHRPSGDPSVHRVATTTGRDPAGSDLGSQDAPGGR